MVRRETTRNNSLNLIQSQQASRWFLRAVACAASYPVSFLRPFIRPSSDRSFDRLAACRCVWVGWFLTRVLTRLVASGLWTTRFVVPERDDLACEFSLVVLAKDTIDCRDARKILLKGAPVRDYIEVLSPHSDERSLHVRYISILFGAPLFHLYEFFHPIFDKLSFQNDSNCF